MSKLETFFTRMWWVIRTPPTVSLIILIFLVAYVPWQIQATNRSDANQAAQSVALDSLRDRNVQLVRANLTLSQHVLSLQEANHEILTTIKSCTTPEGACAKQGAAAQEKAIEQIRLDAEYRSVCEFRGENADLAMLEACISRLAAQDRRG